jgi:hypothetical protein
MKPSTAGKSLKSANLPWLVSLVVLDILILLAFVFPDLIRTTPQLTAARAMVTLVLPVAILLLSGLLSHKIKASLVYWKLANVLPAHEAFTKHGSLDTRIDMAGLQKNIGDLPTIPAEQNRLWFKLYNAVEAEPAVVEAHKMYLLYRDMAAISFPLLIVVPVAFYLNGFAFSAVWTAAGVFALQYLIAAISARHSGIRLVTNVLAIHSAARTSPPAKSPSPRKSKSSARV